MAHRSTTSCASSKASTPGARAARRRAEARVRLAAARTAYPSCDRATAKAVATAPAPTNPNPPSVSEAAGWLIAAFRAEARGDADGRPGCWWMQNARLEPSKRAL